MFSLRKISNCIFWNLRMLRKNPRMILSMAMGFLICFFLTEKVISLSREFLSNIQIFEPFIWCFADSDSILFASLALTLLLSQIPQLDAPAASLIFRAGRINWLVGQIFTALIVSFGYVLFLLLCSIVLTAGNASLSNTWSDTATLLSFSPASFEVALTVVRKTVKLTTPYACAANIFWLMAQYTLMLTMLNLAVSLRYGKKAGVSVIIVLSLFAYLLSPDRFMVWFQFDNNVKYYANLFAAWLSPLQHATYPMHSFGYDKLPSVTQTHLIFGTVNLLLTTASSLLIRGTQFHFSGGEGNE